MFHYYSVVLVTFIYVPTWSGIKKEHKMAAEKA
jgi:hypothetical protein